MSFALRDYQERGVEDIRVAYGRGARRVLYQLPTGGGKTVLFSYVADHAADKGKRVAILVHRRELLLQASSKLGREHGLVQADFTPNPEAHIQVASVQTLVKRLDKYKFDLVIIDEAHHTPAATYRRILEANPSAHVLGVTATPCRTDGKGLDDLFDVMVKGPSVEELTARGFLAEAKVYAPSKINVDGVHTSRGDYLRGELEQAADRPTITGDAIDHYRRLAHRKPAIAFCVSCAHADHVAEAFRNAGYRAKQVDGSMKKGERDADIAALGNGGLDVLTSCDLISEGVDVPVVECGIMLRPTQSLALHFQQMGRILRPAEGKERAVILDHAGNCLRHGALPDTPIPWSLKGKEKKNQGEVFRVQECPECSAVHPPARVCPECGYVYAEAGGREVEEVDGVLEELSKEEMKRLRKREQSQARSYEELVQVGISREYQNPWAWARHVMASRRGKQVGATP